jgi:ribonuclease R
LKTRFPQIVTDEAEKLKFKEKVDRVDLTNTLIFTIDGEDAKDLDDAISIERIDPPLTPPLVKGENTPHLTSPLAD